VTYISIRRRCSDRDGLRLTVDGDTCTLNLGAETLWNQTQREVDRDSLHADAVDAVLHLARDGCWALLFSLLVWELEWKKKMGEIIARVVARRGKVT